MQIPFSAYAADCTVSGELALRTDRLSDFLASMQEYEITSPSFRALDDGRIVSADSCAIERDDLCIIMATGPRGRVERRLWTRQYPVRARVGPYVVLGYLHAPPTIDPLRTADRRPIVALTDCIIEYVDRGEAVRIEAEAILLNGAKIDHLEPATDDDLRVARNVEIPAAFDPRTKDLTADLLSTG